MAAQPAPTQPARRISGRALAPTPELLGGAVLTLLAFVAYWLTGPTEPGGDSFVPLAGAFLDGRLSIPQDRPWLELVPASDGGQYSPFPPVPAVLLMPLVAVHGLLGIPEPAPNAYAAVVGAANVALVFWLLGRIAVAASPRLLLTAGFAFTTHWWVAGMAGTHHWAQVVGVLFSLLALHAAVGRRWPVLAGLLLGLAAGARLPMGLALPLLLAFYSARRPSRAHLELLAGLALPALLIAGYNLARFGSPLDFGYARIPSGESGLVTDEPWFRHGLVSPLYIPRHLYAIVLQSFEWVDAAPYLRPNFTGLSLTLSAPFLFLAARAWSLRAREPLVPVALLSVGLILLPDLMHGSWGFAQFGYRFALDAVPVLILLLGWAYRDRASPWLVAAVALGIAVHVYGIYVINVVAFVS